MSSETDDSDTDRPDRLEHDADHADAVNYLAVLLGSTSATRREHDVQRRAARDRLYVRPGAPSWITAGLADADREALAADAQRIEDDEKRVRAEMVAAHWRVTGLRPGWADPGAFARARTGPLLQHARDAEQDAGNAIVAVGNREHRLRRRQVRALGVLLVAGIVTIAGAVSAAALYDTAGAAPLAGVAILALLTMAATVLRMFRANAELATVPDQLEARTAEHQRAQGEVTIAMSAHYLAGGDPWRDADTWPAVRRTTIPLY